MKKKYQNLKDEFEQEFLMYFREGGEIHQLGHKTKAGIMECDLSDISNWWLNKISNLENYE